MFAANLGFGSAGAGRGNAGSTEAVLAMGKDFGLGIHSSGRKGENTCMALA